MELKNGSKTVYFIEKVGHEKKTTIYEVERTLELIAKERTCIDKKTNLEGTLYEFKPYEGKWDDYDRISTHRHNWPGGEYSPRIDMGEKSVEEFRDTFVPYNVHTIVSIKVYEKIKERKLL